MKGTLHRLKSKREAVPYVFISGCAGCCSNPSMAFCRRGAGTPAALATFARGIIFFLGVVGCR